MFINMSFIDASFWVFLAFVAFLMLVGKRSWHALRGSLDQRADRIKREMQEAQQIYSAAQRDYELKQQLKAQAHQQTHEITLRMNEQIQHLQRQAVSDTEDFYQQEQHLVKQRLDLLERSYTQELRDQILQRAIHLSLEAMKTKTSTATSRLQKNQLFDEALMSLDSISFMGKEKRFTL